MTDLNMMMREHAMAGLQTQLDAAVTNGDTAAARKITDDIAKLTLSTAPKAPPFGEVEIRAELNKLDWFGVDPKKSNRAMTLGRDMDPRKFPSAQAFTAALVKAVDEEFKPITEKPEGDDTDPEGDDTDPEGDDKTTPKKPRRTDGPGEGDATVRGAANRRTGPWTKLTDAPADVQKEIKRSADRFVPSAAPKEQRENFIAKALESHYAIYQRTKGKK